MIAKSKAKVNGLAFSYLRFSDPHQALGHSDTRQTMTADELIEMHGLTLMPDHAYNDRGRSGFRGNKQKALDAMLKKIDAGHFQPGTTMIVENIDRLSRKGIRQNRKVVDKIFDAGINILIGSPMVKIYHAADQENNFGDTIELASFAFSAWVYSKNLSDRLLAKNNDRRSKRRNGNPVLLSSVYPCWLEHTGNGKFKKNTTAVKTVRHIFKRTISGAGPRALQRELNQDHKKFPPIGRSKNWTHKFISGTIRGRQVLGELTTKDGEVFPNYYPAIISEDIHLKANMAMASRRTKRGPASERVNLFAGLLFSATDDCPMHMLGCQNKRADGYVKSYRYKSANGRKALPGASSATVDATKLEQMIFELLPQIELERKARNPNKELLNQERYWKDEVAFMQEQISSGSRSSRALQVPLDNAVKKLDEIQLELAATPRKLKEPTKAYRTRLSKMSRGTDVDREVVKDGLRSIVERIDLLLIKMGTHNASPVNAVVEIKFRTGEFVRAIELDDGQLVKVSGKVSESLADQCKNGFRIKLADYRRLKSLAKKQVMSLGKK